MTDTRGRVLVLMGDAAERTALLAGLRAEGHEADAVGDAATAVAALRAGTHDAVLIDLRVDGAAGALELAARLRPRPPLVAALVAEPGACLAALRGGADQVLPAPLDAEAMLLVASRLAARQALQRENEALRRALWSRRGFDELVGESPAMIRALEVARAAARAVEPVLLTGEAGVGKRLLARAIHAQGPSAEGPFEVASCEVPGDVLGPELFGEGVRTVTGATERRRGALEEARGGTLFLEEVGGLDPALQEALVHALSAEPGGPSAAGAVRVVASTRRDLPRAVQEGRFRGDLLALLGAITIAVPPLRERPQDIPLLARRFLEAIALELRRPLPAVAPAAMDALLAHPWPGNVSELRRAVERGALAAASGVIQAGDLGLGPTTGPLAGRAVPLSLQELERRHIAEVLAHTGGNVSRAARHLGIDRVTLYNKMRRYGIRKGEGR